MPTPSTSTSAKLSPKGLGLVPSGKLRIRNRKMDLLKCTPLKFNIAPENGWLEDYFPVGKVTFQGLC